MALLSKLAGALKAELDLEGIQAHKSKQFIQQMAFKSSSFLMVFIAHHERYSLMFQTHFILDQARSGAICFFNAYYLLRETAIL